MSVGAGDAHAYAAGFGLDAVVLRYFTFYGPRQRPDMALARIVDALARGASFELYGDGLQSRSFTYVADGIAATIAAMQQAPAGSLYNVGGGEEATMRDAIGTLEAETLEEWWRAFSIHAGATLHLDLIRGRNRHHIAESAFKALGLVLREAVAVRGEGVPSSKELLG